MRILLPALCVSLFALAACTPPQPPEPAKPAVNISAEQDAIRAIVAKINEQAKAKDAAGAASAFAADGISLNSGMPPVRGEEAVKALYSQMSADPHFAASLTAENPVISSSGDMAYVVGHYSQTMTNPKTKKAVTDEGAYLDVYIKQADGSWKIAADSNVSNVPDLPIIGPPASVAPSSTP